VNFTKSEQKDNTDNVIPAIVAPKLHENNLQLWHERLGYLNISDVRRLERLATGITIKQSKAPVTMCLGCLEGKQ